MQELDLSHNQLTEIKEKTFIGLINLQLLSLNSNQLLEINENTFIGLKNLRIVSMSKIHLTAVQKMHSNVITHIIWHASLV